MQHNRVYGAARNVNNEYVKEHETLAIDALLLVSNIMSRKQQRTRVHGALSSTMHGTLYTVQHCTLFSTVHGARCTVQDSCFTYECQS